MSRHSDETPDWEAQRNRIIGLGDTSVRKSYFPELQQRIRELEKKNEELHAAYEELTATDEELREQYEAVTGKEQELRESEERFRGLIEASPVPIVLVRDGVFVYCNRAFCSQTGYDTADEVQGKPLLDFVVPAQRDQMAGYVRARSRHEPAPLPYESAGLRKDGSPFPYEITIAVIRLPAGLTTMAFITDISERKAAEAALPLGRERLRRAELVAGLGHWEASMETGQVHASLGTRRLYGLQGENLTIPELQGIPLPEYRPMLDAALRALVDDGRPYDVEFRIRRAGDGKVMDIHSIAEYDSVSRVVFGVIQDITESRRNQEALRANEKKFRDIVETSPDIIWEMDLQGNFTYISPRVLELLGYRAEDLVGRSFLSLLAPDQVPVVAEVFRNHCAEMDQRVVLDVIARHADGQFRDMEIRSICGTDADGNVTGFRGTTRDITERKYRERALQVQLNLGMALQNIRGLQETLDACLSAAIEISDMDAGGIYLVRQDGSLTLAVSKNLGADFVEHIARYPADSDRARIVMSRTPVYTRYSRTSVVHTPAHDQEGQRAIAILPVTSGGRVVASLNVASHTRDEIAAAARTALETICTQIGSAIEQKTAEDALQVSEERYRSLVNITDTGYVMLDHRGRVIEANDV